LLVICMVFTPEALSLARTATTKVRFFAADAVGFRSAAPEADAATVAC
jgi:hypothetical protein